MMCKLQRRIAFAAACSDAGLIRQLASTIVPPHHDDKAVGALSNQSDQPSARSQSLIKARAKDQAATHAYRKSTAKISSSVNRSG
jgi:hypothetical protein